MSAPRFSPVLILVAAALVACQSEPLPTEPLAEEPAVTSAAPASGKPGGKGKIDICHRRGNGDFHLINVSKNAKRAHLAHGDGLPNDAVPDRGGAFVFDAQCNVVACEYGEITVDEEQFGDNGGDSTLSFSMSASACACSGEVTQGDDWLSVDDSDAQGQICSIDFSVDDWSLDPLGDFRMGTIATSAGDVDILQNGGNVSGDIDLCTIDPTLPECDNDAPDGDPRCIPGVDC